MNNRVGSKTARPTRELFDDSAESTHTLLQDNPKHSHEFSVHNSAPTAFHVLWSLLELKARHYAQLNVFHRKTALISRAKAAPPAAKAARARAAGRRRAPEPSRPMKGPGPAVRSAAGTPARPASASGPPGRSLRARHRGNATASESNQPGGGISASGTQIRLWRKASLFSIR